MNTTEKFAINLNVAREILLGESEAVARIAENLDESFIHAAGMMFQCEGTVIISGIGKAGIIGEKISATLASTGTPSYFLHAAEAVHGDLGRVRNLDIAVVLSHSGNSEEIVRLIAFLKQLGIKMIGITGCKESPLARHSDVTLWLGDLNEAGPLGLAPSTSTTCMLALGDALALTIMEARQFQAEDYARYHPGGSLGRRLVTVEQAALFSHGKALPVALDSGTVQEALEQAEAKVALRHGCILLVDEEGRLSGILSDGDIRRGLKEFGSQFHSILVRKLMTASPKVVTPKTLASEAMDIFHKHRIDEIPVIDDDGRPVGLIDVQDVLALRILQ